jgi:hypothetical protein
VERCLPWIRSVCTWPGRMQAAQPFCTPSDHLCVVLLVETPIIFWLQALELEFSLHGGMHFCPDPLAGSVPSMTTSSSVKSFPITRIDAQHDHNQLCKIMSHFHDRCSAWPQAALQNHVPLASCNLNKLWCLANAGSKKRSKESDSQ